MNVRETAVVLLSNNIKSNSFINIQLNDALKEVPLEMDRGLLTILVNGTLQKQIQLDFYLEKYIKKDYKKLNIKLKNILRISAYQILFMDKIPHSAVCNEAVKIAKRLKGNFMSGLINGVLRNISRDKDTLLLEKLPNTIKYLVPQFIFNIWESSYGNDVAKKIAKNSQLLPDTTIVLNTANFNKEEILNALRKDSITLTENNTISTACDIAELDAFKKGMFYVQGLSSQVAVQVINATTEDHILDLCASPGGKSFGMQISADNKANIISCDINSKKVETIKNTATRLNLKIDTKVNDATILNNDFINKFDKVICDVPCSCLGGIRKKRDIINKCETDFKDLIEIQRKILQNAAKYVQKDGYIYYSTCTLNSKENSEIVLEFIEKNTNFKIIPIKNEFLNTIACKIYDDYVTILPSKDYDGFFIAKLRKEK